MYVPFLIASTHGIDGRLGSPGGLKNPIHRYQIDQKASIKNPIILLSLQAVDGRQPLCGCQVRVVGAGETGRRVINDWAIHYKYAGRPQSIKMTGVRESEVAKT